jgi:hypothetical protein
MLEAKANWLRKKNGARHIATFNKTFKEMTRRIGIRIASG